MHYVHLSSFIIQSIFNCCQLLHNKHQFVCRSKKQIVLDLTKKNKQLVELRNEVIKRKKKLENVIAIVLALPLSTVTLIVAKWKKWHKAQKHLRSDHPTKLSN